MQNSKLTKSETRFLLDLARGAIGEFLRTGRVLEIEETKVSKKLFAKHPTFVTIYISGKLRGCIGHTEAIHPLYKGVIINALSAAFYDPRFYPLTSEEFEKIGLEISILKNFRKKTLEKIRKGNGVILEKTGRKALFLPQVWEEVEDKEEFLRLLSLKAGLSEGGWKEADFTVFEVEKVS